jgi:hypothetical protein
MDVEKTIEFILESQARLQALFEAHVGQANKEATQTKKQMAEIRQILRETAFVQQEQGRVLAQLAAAQKGTEAELKAFIKSLRHGTNGSNGKKK